MTNEGPPFCKLYVGIRPRLHLLSKSNAGLVYMYLLSRLNFKNGQCDAAAQTVADDLKLNIKTVRKAFDVIEDSGVATRTRRTGISDNWSFTTYDIREEERTLPAGRVDPKDGYTRRTGKHSTHKTGKDPTRKTGNKEEEKKIEETTPAPQARLASQEERPASQAKEPLRGTKDEPDETHPGSEGYTPQPVYQKGGQLWIDGKKRTIVEVYDERVETDDHDMLEKTHLNSLLEVKGNYYVA